MSSSQRSHIRPTFRSAPAFSVTVTRRGFLTGGAAAAALAIGGSRVGVGTAAAQDGSFDVPTGSADVLLRVTNEGGFTMAQAILVQMPVFSLFGDGLLITQGPTTLQFPGPALPNLRARRLSPEGIQAVLTEANAAGLLGADIFLRTDQIADASTTTFTASANGKTTVVSAYALGTEIPPGVTGSVADMYQALLDFQTKLNTLQDWLPAGGIAEEETTYETTRLRVIAIPWGTLSVPQEPTGGPFTWPLETDLGTLGVPLAETDSELGSWPEFGEAKCTAFEGDDAATLVEALTAANAQAEWESNGASYAIFPRPLLPNETGCGAPASDGTPEA